MAKVEGPISRDWHGPKIRKGSGIVVSGWKGLYVLRKKKGPNKSPPGELQRAWINRFTCMAKWSKIPDPLTFDQANKQTKGTGWFYRDLLTVAMTGKLIQIEGAARVTVPTVNVFRTTFQTIPLNTFTALIPDAKHWDTNAFWSPTVNPTRLTAKSAGLYLFGWEVEWSPAGNATRYHRVLVNGTTQIQTRTFQASATYNGQFGDGGIWYLEKDQYLTLQVHNVVTGKTCKLVNFWMLAVTPEDVTP